MAFPGFPPASLAFLAGLAANNDKAWFDAHRDLYEAGYVAPARDFVAALGPRLRDISPGVQFEPRVNGSLTRINRDIRFSRDKRPYKDHLDLWFWHGERRSWDQPGFFFRLTPDRVTLGAGMHGFEAATLERFRQSVIHPRSGATLLAAVAEVTADPRYAVGGETRKRPPRGYEAEGLRARYLLFEGLYATIDLPAEAALSDDLVEICCTHFSATAPIVRWLLAEVGA